MHCNSRITNERQRLKRKELGDIPLVQTPSGVAAASQPPINHPSPSIGESLLLLGDRYLAKHYDMRYNLYEHPI